LKDNYTEINEKTVDAWNEDEWEWGIPVSPEICEKVREGEWNVLLTPHTPVPKDWFPPFKETKILGLASGGGQQMPVFSLLGAKCTVFDISNSQLGREYYVAEREGYEIEIIKGDMSKALPFDDASFDLIFHPVSNFFVEDVYHIWKECFRVLRPGGTLLSGLDNGLNYLFDDFEGPLEITETLPFNPLKNPAQMKKSLEEKDGIQFSHTFDEQIGGQLKAGFVLLAAYEDYWGKPDSPDKAGIPTFWATKAVKPQQ
jgi:SAM-dependent methyltransferase